ncbi:MAG TPA: PKD domain-containing protein, partial [Candidatus Paceibacterota bacterium]
MLMNRAMLLAAFLFFVPQWAVAQVVISEIMYDLETGSDSGREWIEVFNASSSVTFIEWKLFENGSNHTIAAHTGGEMLASGAYAVIADNPVKFLEDWPSYSGLLFDSAFSLSNTGETLVMRCCGSELVDKDSVTYASETGAAGDGKSLHRTSVSASSLIPTTPTPGTGTLTTEVSDDTEEETNDTEDEEIEDTTEEVATSTPNTSTPAPYQSSYVAPPMPVLFADGGDDRTVIVGADTDFWGRAYDRRQEFVEKVRFSWNFGDGTVAEGQHVLHRFEFPGRYAVVLSIALDRAAVSDRMVVTAEPARLAFSVFPDSSIVLENRADKDLNLSRWSIKSFGKTFILPEDTILLAGASLRVAQQTHGLTVGPNAELLYPNGLLALKSGESTTPAAVQAATHAPIVSAPAKSA